MLKVGYFLRYSRIPVGNEIGQFLLQARNVDLQAVGLVDQTDLGADVLVHDAVTETGEVSSGKAVLVGAARDVNQMGGCFQKFLDNRQATGHVPETMG